MVKKLITLWNNIFNRNNIKFTHFYAIVNGTYMGIFLFFVDKIDNGFSVLAIGYDGFDGGIKAVNISKDDIEQGLKHKVIVKAKRIPIKLRKKLINVYNYRRNIQTDMELKL